MYIISYTTENNINHTHSKYRSEQAARLATSALVTESKTVTQGQTISKITLSREEEFYTPVILETHEVAPLRVWVFHSTKHFFEPRGFATLPKAIQYCKQRYEAGFSTNIISCTGKPIWQCSSLQKYDWDAIMKEAYEAI